MDPPEPKQTLSLKNNAVKKVFTIHMKKHRKVPTKMPEAKCFKKKSHKKKPQNRFPKCLKQKKTFPLKKTSLFQKSLKIYMKKVYRTVCQNAWSKKTNTLIEKTILFQQKLINSYGTNATEPSSKMPEAKRKNTLIGKTILFQKNLWLHMKKRPQNRLPKCLKQKNKHSHWKNNSVSKKRINSYEKRPQNRLPKCLKQKKQHFHWKKHSVPKKLMKSYEKMLQNRLPKCLKPKKQTL